MLSPQRRGGFWDEARSTKHEGGQGVWAGFGWVPLWAQLVLGAPHLPGHGEWFNVPKADGEWAELGATRYLAHHHHRPDGAFSQVVVSSQPWYQHKLEQFVLVTQQPLAQGVAWVPPMLFGLCIL